MHASFYLAMKVHPNEPDLYVVQVDGLTMKLTSDPMRREVAEHMIALINELPGRWERYGRETERSQIIRYLLRVAKKFVLNRNINPFIRDLLIPDIRKR